MDYKNKALLLIIMFIGQLSTNAYQELTRPNHDLYYKLAIAKEHKLGKASKIMNKDVFAKDAKVISVSDNPHLQSFIDEAVAKIILNDMGINFCMMFKNDTYKIQDATAVSFEMAFYLATQCQNMLIYKFGSEYFDEMRVQSKPFKRKFFFVIGANEKKPLKSWTSMLNETFLILDGTEPLIEIYKRIIHELYIVYDHKFTLGRGMFNTINYDQYKIKNGKLFSIGAKGDLEHALGNLPLPLLKFTFSITRALMFEDLILKSMFEIKEEQLPEEFLNFQVEQECWQFNRELGYSLLNHQSLFLPVEYVVTSEQESRLLVPHLYLSKESFDDELDRIMNSNLLLVNKKTKKETDFCKYLSTPLMSDFGSFYSRGPRPRVKGGWGGSSKIAKEELNNILNNKDLHKRKKEILLKTKKPKQTVQEVEQAIKLDLNKLLEAYNDQ